MKKIILFLILISLIFLAGCSHEEQNPTRGSTVNEPSDSENTPNSANLKEFTMTAEQWQFTPSAIEVNEGDTVKIKITSADVTHGFSLPDFGIRETLNYGETVEIEFIADKKGTFTFICSVPCGQGHTEMTGTLIVK